MLTLFFTIIFFAELIITLWIVSIIKKADATVCDANQSVTAERIKLKAKLEQITAAINLAHLSFDYIREYIKEKKNNIENFIKNDLMITMLVLILKIPENKIKKSIETILLTKQAITKFFKK